MTAARADRTVAGMARVLCVGTAVLDLVFTVGRHPGEDEEIRAEGLRVAPGGNAANTARVLRQLGHEAALGAVLGEHPAGSPLEEGLRAAGVDLAPARRMAAMPPLSCILLHARGGGRTIVHHRGVPEYALDDLLAVDLAGVDWVHFEARPGPETARMIRHARLTLPRLPISLEVEKPRPGIEECFAMTGLVLFSRGFVLSRGFERPEPFLQELRRRVDGPLLVAAWGEEGAWAIERSGGLLHAPAVPPERVVDTVGAGDAFNAGMIDALLRGLPPGKALASACALAGRKVGQAGFDGIA